MPIKVIVSLLYLSISLCLYPCCNEAKRTQEGTTKDLLTEIVAQKPSSKDKKLFSEGIDFTLDRYPSFLITVQGISGKESFGRWSDGDQVLMELAEPLPDKFILELKAAAFGPNVGKPFRIIIGEIEQTFILESGHPEKMQEISIPFETKGNARSIVIKIPAAISPKEIANSPDERRLGIALASLFFKKR